MTEAREPPHDLDLDRALKVAREVARQAGTLLKAGHDAQGPLGVANKGEVDLVTEFDRRSEALVVQTLSEAFPTHTVVGEEGSEIAGVGGDDDGGRLVWMVDPLDGTTNYAHRMPWYTVSIGLELDRRPVLGVVVAPALGWELWAAEGRGAWLGQRRITVSSTPDLDRALVATGFPYDRRTSDDNNVPQFAEVIRRCQGLRRIGVASLDCALVAQGMLDAYWEYKLKPWDISAGVALVQEAGGRVTLPGGEPYRSDAGQILATNGRVHREMVEALAAVRVTPAP
jgi:myo-inositol-1(or 4)-monophosphatase